MGDYRSFFDRNWLAAFELVGQEVTLTIAKVEGVTVQSAGGSAERKIGIHFAEVQKGMVCNTTNGSIIASLYGVETAQWVGRRITIYPTTTQFGREVKDCIRVRPMIPTATPDGGVLLQPAPLPPQQVQHFPPGWPPPAQHAPLPPPPQAFGGFAPPGFSHAGYGPPPVPHAPPPPPPPVPAPAPAPAPRAAKKGARRAR